MLSGVSQLAGRYDAFILDQWGVLHDGVNAYPGAGECVLRLREAGKRLVVLSNTGQSAQKNLELMRSLGFEPACFERFIGAGEDARAALAERRDAFHRALGRRCYAFTRAGNRSLVEGIGLEMVDRIDDADFVAVIGIDSPPLGVEDYEPLLQAGIRRGLPMICANPDIVRVSPQGTVAAPGALARRYEELGGRVYYHGKPYPAIYASCLRALDGCPPQRVVAIGDSVEHDVLGAARAGLACAFVAGGIHAHALIDRWGELPSAARWMTFAAHAVAQPDYVLPAFVW
jgi:HAD superfamily hydrolase (TIGR01459 family)